MSESAPSAPSETVRVGLIQCGHVRADVANDHGDYPELFASLLSDSPIDLVTYVAEDGQLPSSPQECEAWLVSGSASSVYEPLEWIGATGNFLRQVVEADRPMVAVCFGHQLLAQALGGKVEHSDRGWGVGIQTYDVVDQPPSWPTPDVPATLRLLASHQDQVTELPSGARLLARSQHCPVAAYSIGERVVAVQPHPEFTPALTSDLVTVRREIIGSELTDRTLSRLADPTETSALDRSVVSAWFSRVLTSP